MKMKMFKLVLMFGLLTGCSTEKVNEDFKIIEVNQESVRGELVTGTGEGIYYTREQFKAEGITSPKVGDKVRITWSAADYENQDWENFDAEIIK